MYKDYADIKVQIKYLEAKADEIKENMIKELLTMPDNRVENEYGRFAIGRRNNWTYSPKLESLKADVKSKEIDEQEKGIAKVKVTEFITFKEVAND